jgi:beta-glucosidase/6-phospho-beta-glucosidase/beta-galactosidase
MFATGIENSYPTIGPNRKRIDEMEKCGHYRHIDDDFDRVLEMGIEFLRYGPPIHTTWLGSGKYDWAFADETFGKIHARHIHPIVDLCHFGLPDFIGDFQNPDFPCLFGEYAAAFARRFPWVQLYTPVNEMFICALFSAQYGWWNERCTTDGTFVTALKHIVKANVCAMRAILAPRRDLRAERIVGVLPRRVAEVDSPGGDLECEAVSLARFELRSPRRLGDVRISIRQWDDARRVPLVHRQSSQTSLLDGQ